MSSVTLYVYGGTTPLTFTPDQIIIDEAEGMHDMAMLSFGGIVRA